MSREHEFHHRLWQEIENLGGRCAADDGASQGPCDTCDACQADYSAAIRALFSVVHRHRPEDLVTVPDGAPPLYPGWRYACMSCDQIYPCPELLEIADHLGLEWEAEAG